MASTTVDETARDAPAESRSSSLARRRERQRQVLAAASARQRRSRLLRWAGVAAVGVALVVGGYWYFTAAPSAMHGMGAGRASDPRITLVAGQSAPDFTLPAVQGNEVRLSDYRGKQAVLLFFQEGAMCPPCWQQMRELQSNRAALDDLNVTLVTIAVDPPQTLAEMAAREQVADMRLLYDENARVSGQYQATYISMHPGERPGHTFVLVDKDGTIRWRQDFVEMYVPTTRITDSVQQALRR